MTNLKTCKNCHQLKYIDTDFNNSTDTICKSCMKEIARVYTVKPVEEISTPKIDKSIPNKLVEKPVINSKNKSKK